MKKLPSNDKLIELARLAPKVEWRDVAPKPGRPKEEDREPTVLDFLDFVEVRAGKFEVRVEDFYTIFSKYDDTDMTYRSFRKELKKYVKFCRKDMFCKLNKKLITIEEYYKEVSSDEEEE